jgi:uncharacterized protein YcfL
MKKLLALILVLVCAAGMAFAGFGVSASGSTGTNVVYAARAGDFISWAATNTLSTNTILASRVSTNTVGSRVVTNKSTLSTNVFWFDARGFLTNLTVKP